MSDSSSDEDYRKLNRKAKKSQVRPNAPDADANKFAQDFAQKLLLERGFNITEEEMGFKKKEVKQVKTTTYVHAIDQATFKELQKEFNKCENIGQICTILKALSTHKEATPQQQQYYKIQRADFLIRTRMFEEAKTECFELLTKELPQLDKVKVLLSLCRAQLETNELYNGFMQTMRLRSHAEAVKIMPSLNLGIYDLTPEQIYKQIDDLYQNTLFKIQRDNKKALSLLSVQGNSATGCLGQGDLTQCSEITHLQTLKNRTVLSIACGEHHILVLLSGCSCINPFSVNQCKGVNCNGGNEVFGWGENFLGQVTMDEQDGNFISTPFNVSQLSGKCIVGVAAYKSTSLAWDAEGKIYTWGAKHPINIEPVKGATSIQLGGAFAAILKQKELFVIGVIDPQIQFKKLTKLASNVDQVTCGDNHLVALTSEGLPFGIGSNTKHQLGISEHPTFSQIHDEECFFVQAHEDSTVFVTSEGEVLYCGQVSQEKVIEYPKTLQIDEDVQIIQACSYAGQIYALNLQGKVYKWDLDKEPKARLFFAAPIRQLHLCRGIRLCETTPLQGEWCRIELEDDEVTLETFTNINVMINLGDKYGPYGIKQTHPIRYTLYVGDDEVDKEQLQRKCQVVSMSKIQQQQENKIYLNFLSDSLISKAEILNTDDTTKHKLVIQVQKPGDYFIYLYLNELLLIDCPLQISVQAGSKQDELIQEEERRQQQLLAEQQRKQALLMKKQQEEEEKQRMLREQAQELQQRQVETKKRADEAFVQHQQKLQEEKRIKEEERLQKRDLLTGGGFDLNKAKQKEILKQQQTVQPTQQQAQGQKIIKSVNQAQASKIKQQIQAIQQNNQPNQQKQQTQSQPPKLNPVKATPKALQSIQQNKTNDKAFSTQETFKEFSTTGQFRKTDSQLQKIQQELQQEYQQLKKKEINKYMK